MKHVIIGTAGHIDHGKTTLVKALTNIETDRLKEEKERGITIELGFAYFDLPSGRRAGIVDVPGHERFIKNMLAGAGGVDLVVLVIAADEGVMPQTLEHLHILSLLNTKKGIVALTKADTVDEEWLELVVEDVRDQLAGSFLAEAPIMPVSSLTRQGIDELVAEIDRMTEEVEARDTHLPARLPIDRVFSITGFGTVVTGTLVAGTLQVGDKAEVHPAGLETRIRTLQVHGQKVDKAFAGQRVAVNLAGLQVSDLERGNVLAVSGLLSPSLMLDVRLDLLKDAAKALENRTRVRLYTGTSEVLCRVVLLDAEVLLPGERVLAQLRLEEPIALQTGDRFVIRSYSPMLTIGGGVVLDAHPKKRKRFKQEGINELLLRESGEDIDILSSTLLQYSDTFPTAADLFRLTGRPADTLDEVLEELEARDLAIPLTVDGRQLYLHQRYLEQLAERAQKVLDGFHKRYPLRPGMPKEELRGRICKQASTKLFNSLLTLLANEGKLIVQEGVVADSSFEISFTGAYAGLRERVLAALHASPHSPPDISELKGDLMPKDPDKVLEVINALHALGDVVKVNNELIFAPEIVAEVKSIIIRIIQEQGSLTLADLRDALQTSRKYALGLLEYFDGERLTQRKGDARVLHPQARL